MFYKNSKNIKTTKELNLFIDNIANMNLYLKTVFDRYKKSISEWFTILNENKLYDGELFIILDDILDIVKSTNSQFNILNNDYRDAVDFLAITENRDTVVSFEVETQLLNDINNIQINLAKFDNLIKLFYKNTVELNNLKKNDTYQFIINDIQKNFPNLI